MLVAERLTRKYGDFTAVSDVSFTIKEGEIVGLLGHNGAGKTTVMKMLTGYLEPTDGRVLIDGADIEDDLASARAQIGYLPENCPVYPEMTVVDYLDYAASLRGVDEGARSTAVRDAIAATNMGEKAGAPISALSRGLRQRVGVAQAILHQPKIVILDEPTNGLDPSQIRQMRALIKRLAETATVILSTHILQEVDAVCERAVIINRGRVAFDAPLADLRGAQRLRLVSSLEPTALRDALSGLSEVDAAHAAPTQDPGGDASHAYDVPLTNGDAGAGAAAVVRRIVERGGDVMAIHPINRDLETVFAEVSSGKADVGAAQTAGETAHA